MPKLLLLSDPTGGASDVRHLASQLKLELTHDRDDTDIVGVALVDAEGVTLRLPRVGQPAATLGPAASGALAKALHEERHRTGRRSGRRPVKPSRMTTTRIADLRRPDPPGRPRPMTYTEVAQQLERDGVRTAEGKTTWHPTTVKRAIQASKDETHMLLRRLGNLLTELETHGSVDQDGLVALGKRHGVHHNRLVRPRNRSEQFGHPYQDPLSNQYAPPVAGRRRRFSVTPQGERLLGVWRRSEALDDALESAILEARSAAVNGEIEPEAFVSACRRHSIEPQGVRQDLARFEPSRGRYVLTDEGEAVAAGWDAITNDDPRHRLDVDYWPEPHEETVLREKNPKWDWAEDPFTGLR